MGKVENSDKKKVETPAEIWNSLVGKELTDVDIEEYANRLKVARENKKSAKRDRSAKILTENKQTDNNSDEQVEKSDANKKDKSKSKLDNKSVNKNVKIKGTNVREDFAAKIGAFVFFGIFGVIQIWLIIDWLIKGCLLDTLALHLLPVIIVVCLFVITSVIDLVSNRGKKKEQVEREEAVKKYNRSKKNKKGGK